MQYLIFKQLLQNINLSHQLENEDICSNSFVSLGRYHAAWRGSSASQPLDYFQNDEDLESNVNVGGQRYAAIETYSEEQEKDVEVEDISITGYGPAGNILNAALNGALGSLVAITPNAVRIIVSCGTCTRVLVRRCLLEERRLTSTCA